MAQTTALPSHAPLVSQLARATSFTEIGFRIPTYSNLSDVIQTYPNLPNMCEPRCEPIRTYLNLYELI